MSVSAAQVAELRKITDSGMRDCKKALTECDANMDKAVEWLRKKGLSAAGNKTGRSTNAGRVFSYIHSNGLIGVLVEVACESDFVANTEQFQTLGKDLCMHVCAAAPTALKREDVPSELVEKEKEIMREQMKKQLDGKPEEMKTKIIEGKMNRFYKENVLLEQAFIKDDKKTIDDVVKETIGTLKENISLNRFSRFQIGAK